MKGNTEGNTEGHTEGHTQGTRLSYEILSYVKSVGIFPCHTSSHTAQSTMAKNVIALSYVRMTSAMTNRKIVKRLSYARMTTL